MGQGHEFSDEFISAFVDGQMIPEERAQVYAQAASDEAFNRRVCELRKIRDLIQLAYRELPKPGRNQVTSSAKAIGVAE